MLKIKLNKILIMKKEEIIHVDLKDFVYNLIEI